MTHIIKKAGYFLLLLAALDLFVLFASLAQVAVEGRTGYWSPFWAKQAEVVAMVLR